ncbi:PREDICTED: nuclear pore complex protein NUP43 [Fragaria vesca subsp. vesca]|uniref:nuclear pore complex protein NUP43 n=1 Tax=Fragaria vesca subsp. vesca TaxID=101020 RepID=UPI0002C31F1C|nr:PREDICTED: nuclear pore complex protein NUP43 [Fragaria vesca subsp. vesca]
MVIGTALSEPPKIHRFPQPNYIDSVRWLPPVSALDRLAVIAVFDSDKDSSSIEIHSFTQDPSPNLTLHSQWDAPSRISSLTASQFNHRSLVAAATLSGSLHVLLTGAMDPSEFASELSVPEKVLHDGAISCGDVMDGGVECVTVGEDGRVNVVSLGEDQLSYKRIFDSSGLVSFTSAKWASPSEFATGGFGFSLQWWDQRKTGGAVSQFKGDWNQSKSSGIVHSIDIHPSRKHTCLAGGSLGTVFAWDLRWPQQPLILSGVGSGEATCSPCESEVWEVQYDPYVKSTNVGSGSSRILPTMICSEDGILAVVEQGEEPIELSAEPCAINSFDIDQQSPSDVIYSLEWESIAILTRP